MNRKWLKVQASTACAQPLSLGLKSSNRFIVVVRSGKHRYWLHELARLDHGFDEGHEFRHDQQLTCVVDWFQIALRSPNLFIVIPGEGLLRRFHTKQRNLNLLRRLPLT